MEQISKVVTLTNDRTQTPYQQKWRKDKKKNNIFRKLLIRNQIAYRIFKRSSEAVLRDSLYNLMVAASGVFLIGCYEASLIAKVRNLKFFVKYSMAQMLPSIIWHTKRAPLIAKQLNLKPDYILRNLNVYENQVDAIRESRIEMCQTSRSIIAGFFFIAQILHLVHETSEIRHEYFKEVLEGKEPMIDHDDGGMVERVIRLAGRQSDVTEYSVSQYGRHIIPVVEEPENFKHIIFENSEEGLIPMCWNVSENCYGLKKSWKGFNIEESWGILNEKTQEKYLIIEADSSLSEQSLALGFSNDLTLQEVSQGYRHISNFVSKHNLPLKPVCVLLADEKELFSRSGGQYSESLRERIKKTKECDILIDAKKPLIKEIVQWIHKHGVDEIVFDTTNNEYYNNLSNELEKYNIRIVSEANHLPHLFYYERTADTINEIRSALEIGVDNDLVCAFLDTGEGSQEINQYGGFTKTSGEKIDYINSAEIYDDLFATVRYHLRQGRTISEIQEIIDDEMKIEPF